MESFLEIIENEDSDQVFTIKKGQVEIGVTSQELQAALLQAYNDSGSMEILYLCKGVIGAKEPQENEPLKIGVPHKKLVEWKDNMSEATSPTVVFNEDMDKMRSEAQSKTLTAVTATFVGINSILG